MILPIPPSTNQHYRAIGARSILSKNARLYRDRVLRTVREQGIPEIAGKIAVEVAFTPKANGRRRDVDNILKPLFDAMQHAGVYKNDNQIENLKVERTEPEGEGALFITIRTIQ